MSLCVARPSRPRAQDRILVELRLHAPHIARRMEAGSYVFLNVPAASATPWDWHPYSISSAPFNERDEFTLHVLAYVPNTESVCGGAVVAVLFSLLLVVNTCARIYFLDWF